MSVRTVLFWTHLTAGVVAGTVILIMSVTGTLLTFQQSVLKIVEQSQRYVEPPPGARRLDLDALLTRVKAVVPDAQPATLTLESDPQASVAVGLGTRGSVFVNPYTGEVLGTGATRMRAFYRSMTSWHRYLSVEGGHRAIARAITGACNAAFLSLALSGLYLWWPRQWTPRHLAAVTLFTRGLRGKARDFNWHNTIGFWCVPVIAVLTATGMVMSYAWANNLVYTLTGSPKPSAPSGETRGGRGGDGPRGTRARAHREISQPGLSLESMFVRAEQQIPTWRTMIIRLPAQSGGPVAFSISDRAYWNSFARSTLTLDGATGADLRWEPYAASSAGQKLRGWIRFAHTGELGGLAGEAIAGVASAGGAFLVWTGLSLALRRWSAWRSRRRAALSAETPTARVA
jgi:uncharacterized iron-regulated membrane protein